jgi:hypothetical protein
MAKILRATKLDVLLFIRRRKLVAWWDLREYFRYTEKSAIDRLYHLKKAGLIANFARGNTPSRMSDLGGLRYYGR